MTCGTTAPVTFTINNNNNTTGITGYTWNIGTTPNGWLYNGVPAPATITTTANSITLSPNCGSALSSISATVAVGTTTYNAGTKSLTIEQPVLSVVGSQSLCSGSTSYLINNLACNSTVLWTAPPSNMATLSSLTSQTPALTYAGTSGNFTLTANVTSCGVTSTVNLPVHVGPYTESDFTLTASGGANGYLSWCPNTTYGFTLGGPASNYNWSYPTGWSPNYISGYVCAIRSPSTSYPPTGNVSCMFTEPCGTTISKTIFVAHSSSGCSLITEPAYTYWPNPVTYSINISVASANAGLITIRAIEIVNASNYMTVFSQNYGTGVTNASVTTYYYQPGNYLLRVYDGNTWRAYQFLKL